MGPEGFEPSTNGLRGGSRPRANHDHGHTQSERRGHSEPKRVLKDDAGLRCSYAVRAALGSPPSAKPVTEA